MKRLVLGNHKHTCPQCGSREVRRSKKHGLLEQLVSRVLSIHPYRCEECDYRHFRVRFVHGSRHATHRHTA